MKYNIFWKHKPTGKSGLYGNTYTKKQAQEHKVRCVAVFPHYEFRIVPAKEISGSELGAALTISERPMTKEDREKLSGNIRKSFGLPSYWALAGGMRVASPNIIARLRHAGVDVSNPEEIKSALGIDLPRRAFAQMIRQNRSLSSAGAYEQQWARVVVRIRKGRRKSLSVLAGKSHKASSSKTPRRSYRSSGGSK